MAYSKVKKVDVEKMTFKNKWIIVLWNKGKEKFWKQKKKNRPAQNSVTTFFSLKDWLSVHGIEKKFGLNFTVLTLGVNLFIELTSICF